MLEQAGFEGTRAFAPDTTVSSPTGNDDFLVFIAHAKVSCRLARSV